MGIAAFWVLCGIVSAVVAANKGRSGCGWLIVGFLLGPIGIILALVVKRDTAAIEAAEIAAGASRRCPACAELVKVEAIKCRHCGAALPPVTLAEPARPINSLRDILILAVFGALLVLFVAYLLTGRN